MAISRPWNQAHQNHDGQGTQDGAKANPKQSSPAQVSERIIKSTETLGQDSPASMQAEYFCPQMQS